MNKPTDNNPYIDDLTLNVITQEFTNDSIKAIRLADRIYEWMKSKHNNEAIDFSEWIDNNHYFKSANGLWYYQSDGDMESGFTTEKLFKIFQMHKNK